MTLSQLLKIDKEHETTGTMNYAERNSYQNKKLAEATSSKRKQNEYDAEYEEDNEDNDEYDASDYKTVEPDVEGGKVTYIKLTPAEKAAGKRVRSSSTDTTDNIFEGYDCDKAVHKAIDASAAAVLLNAQNESRRIDFQFQQQDQQNKMLETMLKLFAERK